MSYLTRLAKHMVAQLLERDELEAVMGDLTEMRATPWRSSIEILGLIVRRQAAHWSHGFPWVAAFGLALPGTLLLQGTSYSISCRYQGLTGAGICNGWSPAGGGQLAQLPCLAVLLVLTSWSLGFLTSFISRRTLWASAILVAAPCLYCQAKFHEAAVSRLCLLLFLPLMAAGACQGLRGTRIRPATAIALTAVSTVLTLICNRM
jgi:hypothetical protein